MIIFNIKYAVHEQISLIISQLLKTVSRDQNKVYMLKFIHVSLKSHLTYWITSTSLFFTWWNWIACLVVLSIVWIFPISFPWYCLTWSCGLCISCKLLRFRYLIRLKFDFLVVIYHDNTVYFHLEMAYFLWC